MHTDEDNDLDQRYAWVDQRLEQLYLHDQPESLLDEDQQDGDEDSYISEDHNQMDNNQLTAYDQGEGDDDFRIICRRLFPEEDDNEETESDILSEMSVDFDLYYEGNEGEVVYPQMPLLLPEGPPLTRANTQFQINGYTIYNGNPNGNRFFDNDDFEPENLEPIT